MLDWWLDPLAVHALWRQYVVTLGTRYVGFACTNSTAVSAHVVVQPPVCKQYCRYAAVSSTINTWYNRGTGGVFTTIPTTEDVPYLMLIRIITKLYPCSE